MSDVFLSYGGPDLKFATRLCERLREAGLQVEFFPDSAGPGRKLHKYMRDGVNEAKCTVLICSRSSLTRSGVENEIEETLAREASEGGKTYLIPIALDRFVFEEWEPREAGTARAIRQRVIGDFTTSSKSRRAFEVNLGRLLKEIKERGGVDATKALFDYDPESGKPDERFGVSEWPRSKGRLSFIKWWDPGGRNYNPSYPYDRPNRVMTVKRTKEGKRQWWEYNLTRVEHGREVWQAPAHHWVEAEYDFAAVGNHRVGSVFFRKDVEGLPAGDGLMVVFEFFVPIDSVEALQQGRIPRIYMRKTTDLVGTCLERREVPIHLKPFEETDFIITALAVDA